MIMQVAGSTCRTCNRRIVFADEGQFCAKCEIALHLACAREAACPVCGGPLKEYERPQADPESERVRFDPQVDRLSGPATAALFVVLGLVVVMWLVFWEIVRPQGY